MIFQSSFRSCAAVPKLLYKEIKEYIQDFLAKKIIVKLKSSYFALWFACAQGTVVWDSVLITGYWAKRHFHTNLFSKILSIWLVTTAESQFRIMGKPIIKASLQRGHNIWWRLSLHGGCMSGCVSHLNCQMPCCISGGEDMLNWLWDEYCILS